MNTIENVGKACTGCAACAQACPENAIQMRADAEGFLCPVINKALCVGCGRCKAVCAQLTPVSGRAPLSVFAAYSIDIKTLENSSSGGLFTVAARHIFERGGVVCAVALQKESWRAKFVFAANEEELKAMRGSKYVQADVGEAYTEVKACLSKGKQVLFAGCGCHVAALKAFLGKEAEGLFTIDIICHGVPSPLMFQKYVQALEEHSGKLSDYVFRDKRHGWGMRLSYQAGGKEKSAVSMLDPYNFNFLKCRTYRESCYECRFAAVTRQGDWTIGDYWGVLREHPGFYNELGVSALLVNTQKGQKMLEETREQMKTCPSSFEAVARHNENLLHPSRRPKARDSAYAGINEKAAAAFVRDNLKVQASVKDRVKALVPGWVKRLYQRSVRK